MSDSRYSHTPEQATVVLTQFVETAEHAPTIGAYDQLGEVINLDVRLALSSLIMQRGVPPRRLPEITLMKLENKHLLSKVQGVVHNERGSTEPSSIVLGKYIWPYRFGISWRQIANMDIDGDSPFVYADDGLDGYSPSFASPESVAFYREVIGDTARPDIAGKMQTGIEIAEREERMAPYIFTNYLHTVSGLVKGLIET